MNRRKGWKVWLPACAAAMLLILAGRAAASIKLTSLPLRDRVELQLDNAEATLVEEERIVALLKGTNNIDFSWSNTAIDKGTILFRVVEMPLRPKTEADHPSVVRPDGKVEKIQVINVAYPPDENALTWEVFSEEPVAARVRISYLIGNLKRSFNYRAVAEQDESTLALRNYLGLANFSGEEFGDSGIWAGFGSHFLRQIGMNEAKELLMWKFPAVPIHKTFTFNWWTGKNVPNEPDERYVEMRYVLTNDEKHKLGAFPLQYGKVRIFQKDGHGGEAFIGEDWGHFTAIDDEMKLYLGLARDVVVRRKIADNRRNNVNGNLYHQEVALEYKVENFKTDAVVLDIEEDVQNLRDTLCGGKDHQPQVDITTEGTTIPKDQIEWKDSRTVVFHVPLKAAPAGEAKAEALTVKVHLFLRNEW